MNEKRNKALMATTRRHFNRNIFVHVTWQQETAWPADRRSEVVRERPITTQINTQPVKSAGKSIGEGFTKVQGFNNTPEITSCSAISPFK